MTFDEIINSISDKEMVEYLSQQHALKGSERALKDAHLMMPAEQRYNLAFYAKAAREHVGWDGFSEEYRDAFMTQVERLYNNIKRIRRQDEFMSEVFAHTGQYMEDRHFSLRTGERSFSGGGLKSERSVGRNFAKEEEKPEGYECLGKEIASDGTGTEFVVWEIGCMKSASGEDVLMVSLPHCDVYGNNYEEWAGFIEKFDEVYLGDKEKWEHGRIILDVRNNKGGEDKPLDHLAKRLYGNMVNTYKRCEIRDTALSNALLHTHGAFKVENLARAGLEADFIKPRNCFSGQNRTLFDETNVYYPFNPEKGYRGRLDILIDREVGSSAESAYSSFYHHPNVRYIGENTAGMQQYTQGTFALPCGYEMRVGVTKLTYYDKDGENIEVHGHKPDVNCSGRDALDCAMTMGRDEGRVIGFREMNESLQGERRFVDYHPRDAADPRKAYYAIYLEPALRQIEQQNKDNLQGNNMLNSKTRL